jgi:hypothetical protein
MLKYSKVLIEVVLRQTLVIHPRAQALVADELSSQSLCIERV